MSELHQAVEAQLEAHRPDLIPPFSAIRARKRKRESRRTAAAVGLTAMAVLLVAVGASATGLRQHASGVVAQQPDSPPDDIPYNFTVAWGHNPRQYSPDVEHALRTHCFGLPGVTQEVSLDSSPPILPGQVVGLDNAETLNNCVEQNAPGADIVVTTDAGQTLTLVSEEVEKRLLALADQDASDNGGEAKNVEVVRTTVGQAQSLGSRAKVAPGEPAWFVQVSGTSYSCTRACPPGTEGEADPQSKYLTLLVAVGSYDIKSTGGSPNAVDLEVLGVPKVLRGQPQANSPSASAAASPTPAASPTLTQGPLDDNAVALSITTEQSKIVAPGTVTWTLRIVNTTSRTLRGLRLAESVAIAGDPEGGVYGTEALSSGNCGAAMGTSYCPLPDLAPGQVLVGHGSAKVPTRFSTGPELYGQRVTTYEQVVSGPVAQPVSQPVRLDLPITRD